MNERLEEIKNNETLFSLLNGTTWLNDLNWLIEQAERVQELEEIIGMGNRREAFIKIYEQNQRYREAIEKAFKELKYGDSYNAELILVEALEESE